MNEKEMIEIFIKSLELYVKTMTNPLFDINRINKRIEELKKLDSQSIIPDTLAHYDEERMMHYTIVGTTDLKLILNVFGDTPQKAIEKAKVIAQILEDNKGKLL